MTNANETTTWTIRTMKKFSTKDVSFTGTRFEVVQEMHRRIAALSARGVQATVTSFRAEA